MKSPPPKLAAILDLVNLVPVEAELLDVYQVWKDINKRAIKDYNRWFKTSRKELKDNRAKIDPTLGDLELLDQLLEHSQRMIDSIDEHVERSDALGDSLSRGTEAVNQCLIGLPEKLQNYVWQKGEEQLERKIAIYEAMARYAFVRESRDKLRKIVELMAMDLELWERSAYFQSEIKTQSALRLDENGVISIARDKFAAAVEDVEANRIKECAICRRIFWAGRITQQGCSVACAHALRNRRYRAKYKDYLVNQVLKEKADNATKKSIGKKGK